MYICVYAFVLTFCTLSTHDCPCIYTLHAVCMQHSDSSTAAVGNTMASCYPTTHHQAPVTL